MRPGSDNPLTAPEHVGIRLSGKAYGHPDFTNGYAIITSRVERVEGRRITTESGRVYRLEGDPEQGYLDWLRETGRAYDPERPIVMRGRAETGQ